MASFPCGVYAPVPQALRPGSPLTPRAVTTADLDEELIGGTGDHSPYRL
jgi:hypothetical protein